MILLANLILAAAMALPSGAGTTEAAESVTPDQLADSVTSYLVDASSVTVWTVEDSVTSLATTDTSGSTSTLALGTDVLFAFGKDRLDAQAIKTLDTRLDDIPKRAAVTIVGYTDSIGSTASNLGLSKRRAKAVAKAVTAARPDLKATASGRGESHPVADNGTAANDNPAGRAKNRRVELSWPK